MVFNHNFFKISLLKTYISVKSFDTLFLLEICLNSLSDENNLVIEDYSVARIILSFFVKAKLHWKYLTYNDWINVSTLGY